jgi:RNA-directed DNA polymerase
MNCSFEQCAPLNEAQHWHSIDWKRAKCFVGSLQARIVKAVKQKKKGKVKSLQWLLTHSFYAKALAVKQVSENKGRNTAGVDGEAWRSATQKWRAIASLKRSGYQARPLRRVCIPKSNGKKRALGIPTMLDRAMQALHLLAIDPAAESLSDSNSFGFRKHRACADAIEQCFKALSRKRAGEWVLDADIQGCFDNISHEWMLEHIAIDKPVLLQWLSAGFMVSGKLYPTTAGTPQGGIISPTLMNMVLNHLQKVIEHVGQVKRGKHGEVRSNPNKVTVIRYADDFVVTARSHAMLVDVILPSIEEFMSVRGLALSPTKTHVRHISEGFEFLGQQLKKYNGKLLIKPSNKSIKALMEKVRMIITTHRASRQDILIFQLNSVLRGWCHYHRHSVAKKVFCKIDSDIWVLLWKWACRRHPNKGKRWIRKRYFYTLGYRNWCFCTEDKQHSLFQLSAIPIVRHPKIHSLANPYDPSHEMYFESRFDKWLNVRNKIHLHRLLASQNDVCWHCKQEITKQTGWNIHRLIPMFLGGDNKSANTVVVHPTCHSQLHEGKNTAALYSLAL